MHACGAWVFRRFLGPRATTLSVSPPLWGPRPARRMWPLLIIHPPCCWLAARAQAFYIYSDFRPFFAESRTGVYPGNGPNATLLEAHAVLIIGEAGLVLFRVRAPFGYLRTRCPLLRSSACWPARWPRTWPPCRCVHAHHSDARSNHLHVWIWVHTCFACLVLPGPCHAPPPNQV